MTADLGKSRLVELWHLMDDRNRELGLERYDLGDVHSHPLLRRLSRGRLGRVVARALRAPDLIAPLWWRAVLGVPRTVVPSVFYHLGLSYLDRERLAGGPAFPPGEANAVCEAALRRRLDADLVCWQHPYSHHAAGWRSEAESCPHPPSCAHHTGRVGFMLVTVGRAHNRAQFIDAGTSAARALLSYHAWHNYDDGSRTMSYYPFSDDEVINTGLDAAMLLAAVPDRTDEMQAALDGLLRTALAEQHPDGSWDYCTRRHYERFGGPRVVDNHHTAMVLAALARILALGAAPEELLRPITQAIETGLRFYLDELFLPDGTGLYFPGRRRRTGVVGYTEGIGAVRAALQKVCLLPRDLAMRAAAMLPILLSRAIDGFLDVQTGDVACCRFFGRPYHLRSARWGSAPLMQAVTDLLSLGNSEATDD